MAQKLAELQVLSQENEVLKLRSAVLEAVTSGREYHVSCAGQQTSHACWLLAVTVCWRTADSGVSCSRRTGKIHSFVSNAVRPTLSTMCTTMCVCLLWVVFRLLLLTSLCRLLPCPRTPPLSRLGAPVAGASVGTSTDTWGAADRRCSSIALF